MNAKEKPSLYYIVNKSKAIPVVGTEAHRNVRHRGSHFLDNWLTDGSEVVSLMGWPAAFYLQKDFWYSVLLEAQSNPKGVTWLEQLEQMKNPMTSSGIEPTTFLIAGLKSVVFHTTAMRSLYGETCSTAVLTILQMHQVSVIMY
jgi:hypothetical protein